MKLSEKINELAEALATAQGQFTAVEREHLAKVNSKKGEGSSYSYNYADLAAYLDVCRPHLAANGLAVVQEAVTDGQKANVSTLLIHKSGQYIQFDPLGMTAADLMPQSLGSAITYGRRYALSAATGMASEADDDGSAASGVDAETSRRAELPPCPKCQTNKSVIVGKPEYGGGFVCYGKKGGCGNKWQTAPEIPPEDDPFRNPAPAVVDDLKKQGKLSTADKLPAKKVPRDPEGNFDHVGYFKKKIGIENTSDGLDTALRELKENKDSLGGDYKALLQAWFSRAIELAPDNDRVRALDGLLAKAREPLGDPAWTSLGAALDQKYRREAVA